MTSPATDDPGLPLSFLSGGGHMGERMRARDWSTCSIGPPDAWPAPLRTAIRILLTTNHPVFVFWGPEHLCFYNDAYSRSIGPEKHPSILGARGRDAWEEIWPIIGPQIDQVMTGGGATWHENQLVPIIRHGQLEQVYWTYSYGPIDDACAPHGVGGVLVLCTETTEQVLAQQRMRAAEMRWRSLFDQTPGFVCVLEGPDHTFEYANRRYSDLVSHRPLIGRTVRDAVPEVEEQGFIALLDRVYRTGEVYQASTSPVMLPRASDGVPTLHYLDFIYQPIRDAAGTITGIFVEGSDVTARKLAELGVEEASRRKDEFLATLSHELRNPLAPIRNAVTILRAPAADAGAREWATKLIDRQVQTMARLLEDLLDITRATRGTLALVRERVSLAAVIEAALEVARPTIEQRHHRLSVLLAPDALDVDADFVRLSQVLTNLLTNAAKYTDAGGRIELSAERVDDRLRISVRDTGIGLAPESLTRVFEMFSQVRGALDRSEGGLGIGLALVKAIVEMHGGHVEAHSAGLGLGSRFDVFLPLPVQSAAAPKALASEAERRPAARKRVLVADDNDDAAQSLAAVLKLWGHEVRVALDGRDAVGQAREFRPDVAFIDIGMPELNGYDVSRAIRAEPWAASLKLVAVTGWGQLDDKHRAVAAGFDVHLTKPVDPSVMLSLLADGADRPA